MENELRHHGILGMKWGVRRYQNEDGSLTEAGKKRYSTPNLDAERLDRFLRKSHKNSKYTAEGSKDIIGMKLGAERIDHTERITSSMSLNDAKAEVDKWLNSHHISTKYINELRINNPERYEKIISDIADRSLKWAKR